MSYSENNANKTLILSVLPHDMGISNYERLAESTKLILISLEAQLDGAHNKNKTSTQSPKNSIVI